ncbi:MAG: hypothetical protein ACKO44_11555 [Algoriphagus sp.]
MSSERIHRLLTVPVEVDIKASFAKAWHMYTTEVFLFTLFMLLILSIQGLVVMYAEQYMIVYSVALAPPLYAGFYLVANKISRQVEVKYMDFFGGFRFWIPLVFISLLTQVLIAMGLVALIVPGIYLGVAYMFATLMGLFGGLDPWTAMEWSRKLITRNWWKFFSLLLILLGINLLGILFLGIGILLTFPLTFLVLYVIFEDLTRAIFAEEGSSATREPGS